RSSSGCPGSGLSNSRSSSSTPGAPRRRGHSSMHSKGPRCDGPRSWPARQRRTDHLVQNDREAEPEPGWSVSRSSRSASVIDVVVDECGERRLPDTQGGGGERPREPFEEAFPAGEYHRGDDDRELVDVPAGEGLADDV